MLTIRRAYLTSNLKKILRKVYGKNFPLSIVELTATLKIFIDTVAALNYDLQNFAGDVRDEVDEQIFKPDSFAAEILYHGTCKGFGSSIVAQGTGDGFKFF